MDLCCLRTAWPTRPRLGAADRIADSSRSDPTRKTERSVMSKFVRKTRIGERVEISTHRAIQLEPDPRPRSLLQRRRTRGMIPSRKMDQMIGWSEPIERDLALHLEYDPAIRCYVYRPDAGQIQVRYRGALRTFTPSYG